MTKGEKAEKAESGETVQLAPKAELKLNRCPKPEGPTIEEHCKGLPPWQYTGFVAAYRFGRGRRMARMDFDMLMEAFLQGPMRQ